MNLWTTAFLAAVLAAGCGSTPEPLPAEPGGGGAASAETPGAPGAPPAPDESVGGTPIGEAFRPSRGGEEVAEGLFLGDLSYDPAGPSASFLVRNGTGLDLPDLILAVLFAYPVESDLVPFGSRLESIEAPLRKDETRVFTVTLTREVPRTPAGFQVLPGTPEILTTREPGHPGTTFLGGLLECVELEADLTSRTPSLAVGLEPRRVGEKEPGLPPLEVQLLLARVGKVVWTGPWILLPRSDPDGPPVRRVRWNLGDAPNPAGCTVYLRVREKR